MSPSLHHFHQEPIKHRGQIETSAKIPKTGEKNDKVLLCFLWKCKSCTLTSNLSIFINFSLNEVKPTSLRVYFVVFLVKAN